MKKITVFAFVLLLGLSNSFANEINKEENSVTTLQTLRDQVVKLLEGYEGAPVKEKVRITFLVNKKSEIVVLTVNTNDAAVDRYVKGKLNYQEVKIPAKKVMKIYEVSIKISKNRKHHDFLKEKSHS